MTCFGIFGHLLENRSMLGVKEKKEAICVLKNYTVALKLSKYHLGDVSTVI